MWNSQIKLYLQLKICWLARISTSCDWKMIQWQIRYMIWLITTHHNRLRFPMFLLHCNITYIIATISGRHLIHITPFVMKTKIKMKKSAIFYSNIDGRGWWVFLSAYGFFFDFLTNCSLGFEQTILLNWDIDISYFYNDFIWKSLKHS